MEVSVAMCTYNGEKYIREQLESIIHQTRKVNEIIISDDGSKDRTLEICEEILSKYEIPYQIIKNDKSLKVMKNFQQAFSLCSKEIIFSCDQDDVWEKNKVEVIMNIFENNLEIDMVASDASLIDGKNNILNMSLRESLDFSMDYQSEILPSLLRTFCITGATMAFRKTFEETYFYVSQYWLHDGWLALQAAMNNSFYYCNERLTKYRLHGNNACGISNIKEIMKGNITELKKTRIKELRKKALRLPFYFEDYTYERKVMYQEVRNQILVNQWLINKNNFNLLEECISFWEIRSQIRNCSLKEIRNITKRFKNENKYCKYCESSDFYFFDIYFWIVYKLFSRKRRTVENGES